MAGIAVRRTAQRPRANPPNYPTLPTAKGGRSSRPASILRVEAREPQGTTRYSSRIDPGALLLAAKTELSEIPARQEQFKIFRLALLCGLRKREIDTLLWRSVDFDKGVIRIERTKYFQRKREDSAE